MTEVRRNLPPQAEPWGRSVDHKLGSLDTLVSRALLDNTNALKGVNSVVKQLAGQVAALQEVTEGLLVVTEQLQTQQEEIVELTEGKIEVRDVGESITNMAVPSGGVSTTDVIDVPTGYTRAIVLGVSTARVRVSDLAGGAVSTHVRLEASSTAGWSQSATITVGTPGANIIGTSATRSRLFTGLSGGTISLIATTFCQPSASADSNNSLNIDGLVLFLK